MFVSFLLFIPAGSTTGGLFLVVIVEYCCSSAILPGGTFLPVAVVLPAWLVVAPSFEEL